MAAMLLPAILYRRNRLIEEVSIRLLEKSLFTKKLGFDKSPFRWQVLDHFFVNITFVRGLLKLKRRSIVIYVSMVLLYSGRVDQ